jgi:hypothetical protein
MNFNVVFPGGLLISAFRTHFVCIIIAPLIAKYSTHLIFLCVINITLMRSTNFAALHFIVYSSLLLIPLLKRHRGWVGSRIGLDAPEHREVCFIRDRKVSPTRYEENALKHFCYILYAPNFLPCTVYFVLSCVKFLCLVITNFQPHNTVTCLLFLFFIISIWLQYFYILRFVLIDLV